MELILHGMIDGLLVAGVYALMASGLTLVFGVMGLINVAQAAFVILGGYLSYTLQKHAGIDLFLGLLITMPVMFMLGVVVERLFLARLDRDRELMSLLVTFAVAIVVEGTLDLIYGPEYVKTSASYTSDTYTVLGYRIPEIYLYACLLSVVLLAGLYLLLYRTTFGRMLRATSENPVGAELVGIDRGRIAALTFGLGTALAAAGGMTLVSTSGVEPSGMYALMPTLLAIVILGGLGSVGGALLASVILLVLQSVTAVVWSPLWSTTVAYAILVVVLLLRPRGLFGRPEARAQ